MGLLQKFLGQMENLKMSNVTRTLQSSDYLPYKMQGNAWDRLGNIISNPGKMKLTDLGLLSDVNNITDYHRNIYNQGQQYQKDLYTGYINTFGGRDWDAPLSTWKNPYTIEPSGWEDY